MNSENCIFCKKSLDGSKEHIIPTSLNGRLTSKDIVCSSCNNLFGQKIDPILKELLNPLLLIFGFKNASSVQISNKKNEKLLVDKSLNVLPVRPTVEVVHGKTGKQLQIQGTPKQVKSVVAKVSRKIAGKNIKLITKDVKQYFSPYLDEVGMPLYIDTEDYRLNVSLGKVAVEFAAYHEIGFQWIDSCCSKIHAMDTLRVKYCNFKNEVRDFSHGELNHLLLIRSEGKILYVYIELFNIICAVVVITENYIGKKINENFQQDSLSGKRVFSAVKLKKSIVEVLRDSTRNDNFKNLISKSSDRLRDKKLSEAMDEGLKDVLENLKELEKRGVDPEIRGKIYVDLAAKHVAELGVFHFPYAISDIAGDQEDEYNFIHSNFRPEIVDQAIGKYKEIIGKKILAGEEVYLVSDFEKRKVKVSFDKELIKLFVILVDELSGNKYICPIKTFLERIKIEKE